MDFVLGFYFEELILRAAGLWSATHFLDQYTHKTV